MKKTNKTLFLTLCISLMAIGSNSSGMRSNRKKTKEEKCIICFELFDETPSRFLRCGHRFHGKCIKPWLADHKTCPICKSTDKDMEEREKRMMEEETFGRTQDEKKRPSTPKSSANHSMETETEIDIFDEMHSANHSREVLATEQQLEIAEELIEKINKILNSKFLEENENHEEMAEILLNFKKLNIRIPGNTYEYTDLIDILQDEDLPTLLQEETTRELVYDIWKLIETIKKEKILENLVKTLELLQSSSEDQSHNRPNDQSGNESDDELFDF